MDIMGIMVNGMDVFNGILECVGGLLIWNNVKRLWKDKEVKGVDWRVNGFFSGWSVWNLWFYSSLNCWLSVVGSGILCLGNGFWVGLYVYLNWFYNKNEGI